MARIKHNDLTHYFMTPHEDLPASYLSSCKKFFDKLQAAGRARASSCKQRSASCDPDGWPSNKLQAPGAMKRTQLKGIK